MAPSPVTCCACGANSAGEGRYCPHCGASRHAACNHCGQSNARSHTRCSHCGERMATSRPESASTAAATSGRPLERRQLTIMFTDLIDSTGLADSMDPEDFQALIEAHRTIAVAPIARFGGVVARYLGDGMLVLFGYPEAHEDDAERAVRAGLEVAKATAAMNERWVGEGRGRIAVRIGVDTGIVVVGDVLKPDVQELMAVFGNVPSIASRLQALAQPNSVILTASTKALLPPAILCETRGNTILKGVGRPIEVFAAREVRAGQGDRRVAGRVLPFVNRESELATIRRLWASAKRGEGSDLLIEGEPGIGKSRLIRAVEERIITKPSRFLITRTSPYATNTEFFAFSELFHQLFPMSEGPGAPSGDSFGRMRKLLDSQGIQSLEIAIGLASLLGMTIPDGESPAQLQPERLRELTLAAITAWLQHESRNQPLVLVVEDLHWADASTLEAIDRLKTTLAHHPLLLIGTTRRAAHTSSAGVGEDAPGTTDVTSSSPAEAKDARTATATQASPAGATGTAGTVVYLERLRPSSAQDLLGHVLGETKLPKAAVTTLLERANGVPLYLEELPKPVLESDGQTGASAIVLPASLRDSLMAQLDRMGEAKAVAQTAAVLGHSFERPLLEHVWEGDKQMLRTGIDKLTDAALIRPEHDSYGFRHALLAEIAYDSLLRDERRRIHKKTADILVNHFQRIAEARPDILARHHESAESHEDAFDCWMKAGEAAAKRSANTEAIGHFRRGEAALDKLKSSGSDNVDERRLLLFAARAPVLIALYGWSAPELEDTYRRILSLSQGLRGRERQQFDAWAGLYNFHLLRGDLSSVDDTVAHMRELAAKTDQSDLLTRSYRVSALRSFLAARYDEAITYYEASFKLSDPQSESRQTITRGVNPLVLTYSFKAWTHWFKGQTEAALQDSAAGLGAAEAAVHPFSMAYALCLKGSLSQCMGDPSAALAHADAALDLSKEYDFPYWQGWAMVVKGWAQSMLGGNGSGIGYLKDGIAKYRGTDASQMHGYNLCLLAEAYKAVRSWESAVQTAREALFEMDRTGIVFYKPEAQRLLAEGMSALSAPQSQTFRMYSLALRTAEAQQSLPLFFRTFRALASRTDRPRARRIVQARAQQMIVKFERGCSPSEILAARQVILDVNSFGQ